MILSDCEDKDHIYLIIYMLIKYKRVRIFTPLQEFGPTAGLLLTCGNRTD